MINAVNCLIRGQTPKVKLCGCLSDIANFLHIRLKTDLCFFHNFQDECPIWGTGNLFF